jgi:hypothetical protein
MSDKFPVVIRLFIFKKGKCLCNHQKPPALTRIEGYREDILETRRQEIVWGFALFTVRNKIYSF